MIATLAIGLFTISAQPPAIDWASQPVRPNETVLLLGVTLQRGITERELIVSHTLVTTSVGTPAITSTIANAMRCPKCGTFGKSGRVSCCAPGGDWFKNCGGARNKNVDHKWFEGVAACKRKCKAKVIL